MKILSQKWASSSNTPPRNTRMLLTKGYIGKCWKWRSGYLQFVLQKGKSTQKKIGSLQKLEKINSRINATPENSSLVNEARKLKIELDEIAVQKTKGSIIRSRARWYELGEKCNKYFFHLEKRSYEKKHNKTEDIWW